MDSIPKDKKAEMALIGSILIDPVQYDAAAALVGAEDFYEQALREHWKAMAKLSAKGLGIDTVTMHSELPDGVSRTIMGECVGAAPVGSRATDYAKIVADLSIYRKMVQAAHDIAKIGYAQSDNVDEDLDKVQAKVYALTSKRARQSSKLAGDVSHDILMRLDSIMTSGENPGIPTGILGLDSIIGGWQKSDLVIVAARPSVGKTALAISSAKHAATTHDQRVAIYSLEMSAQSIGTRLLSQFSGIGVQDILRGRLSGPAWARLASGVNRMNRAPITIDDTPTITPAELRSRARYIAMNGGIDLVVVDYLQLMSADRLTKDANRVIEVAEISRALKQLARELDVPVIALSQLNRSSEHREDGEPRLSDLRDSGAIEQDADIVLMLWRPQDSGVRLKVAKHRNGPIGEIMMEWRKDTVEFK
jgi:replicative DNA helicase